jgi:hypothetical protein
MAKLKISELPVATSAGAVDIMYIVQSGASKSISVGTLLESISGGSLLNRIEGNLTVTGRITANTAQFGRISANTVQLPSYTSVQANVLSASNGIIIYNLTTNKIQAYAGGWVDLH